MKAHNIFGLAILVLGVFVLILVFLSAIRFVGDQQNNILSEPESNIVTYYMPDNVRCYGYTSHTSTIACVVLEPINNDER